MSGCRPGLTEPPSGCRERAGGGGQGRNDGKYNYSHADHPAHLCVLSPPLTPASVLHLHPVKAQKVHRDGDLLRDLSLHHPTQRPLATGTCDY